jgi:hypothetical protein
MFVAVLEVSAQTEISVRVGLNCTGIVHSNSFNGFTSAATNKIKFGAQFGLIANYTLNDNLSIASGLLYSQMGYKRTTSMFIDNKWFTTEIDTSPTYIQIPIQIEHNLNKMFILSGGTYFGFGINGKYKCEYFENQALIDKTVYNIFDSKFESSQKIFDYGLSVGIVLKVTNDIKFGFYSSLGLMNIEKESQTTKLNTNLALIASYRIIK